MPVSSLAARKDLPDVLFDIEIALERLGWIAIERRGCVRQVLLREPRLVFWAIGCLEKANKTPEQIAAYLEGKSVERHWWLLRQLLPDEALYALDRKLQQVLILQLEEE